MSDQKEILKAFEAACQEAAQKREANRELREQYRNDEALRDKIRAELIADLHKVYESPLNPYKGFAASRQRYRQLGAWPEIVVTDFFGNHEEFLRAADLKDSRTTVKCRNKAARLHSEQKIARYADEQVRRWHNAFNKTEGHNHLECVIGSDFHSAFCDPFALHVFLETIRMVQPDVVILNGDVVDWPQVSKHPTFPGSFEMGLPNEIKHVRETILRPVREAAPNATILMGIGNHEHRLVRYLADHAPQVSGLAVYDDKGKEIPVSFESLFGLKELEIGLICRANFLNPTSRDKKRDLQENWYRVGGCYVVTHGVSCAKFAADEQLKRYALSGTSGHTHRPQIITANHLGTGPLSWMSTPMMASFAVGKDYVSEPSAWQMGFGVASIDVSRRLVSQNLVIVHPSWATFAGRSWVATEETLAAREKLWEVAA